MIAVVYNAGRAAITIIPSFKGFHLAIATEVKKIRAVTINIDADVSKAKAKIDEVTGKAKPVTIKAELDEGAFARDVKGKLAAALRALPKDIGLGADATEAEREIASLRTQLETLSNQKIGVDISADQALAEMDYIRTELARLGHESADIQVRTDAGAAVAELVAVQAAVDKIDGQKATVDVKVRGTDGVNFAFRGISNLTTAIVGLAPIAVPALGVVAAGVGAIGSAFVAAGGAAGVYAGVLAGALAAYKEDRQRIQKLAASIGSDPVKNKLLRGQIKDIESSWSGAEKQFDKTREKFAEGFQTLIKNTGPATFGVLNSGMGLLLKLMPRMTPIINGVGDALKGLLDELGRFTKGKQFQGILDFFTIYGVGAIKTFAHIVGNVLSGVFGIFIKFAPYQSGFLNWLEAATAKFAKWANSASVGSGVGKFFGYVQRVLPDVRDLFVNLTKFIGKFVVALGPLAGIELKLLLSVLRGLNSLPPKVLTALAFGITGIVLGLKAWELGTKAVTIAQGLMAAKTKAVAAAQWLLNAAMDANPIGLVIIGIAALAAGMVIAYKKSETFRKIVNGAWAGIKAAAQAVAGWFTKSFIPFFTKTLPNAFRATVNWVKKNWPVILAILTGPMGLAVLAISKNWGKITAAFKAARDWVKGAFKTSWNGVKAVVMKPVDDARDLIKKLFGSGGPVRTAFSNVKDWVKGAWKNTWNGIKAVVMAPINGARDLIKTLFGRGGPVRTAFSAVKDWIKGAWKAEWNGIKAVLLKPLQDARDSIKSIFGKGGPVRTAFSNAVAGIKTIWKDLKEAVKAPIRFIINTVYNKGIVPFVNRIPFIPGELKPIKGWSTGGYTGPGGKYDPAGIVHRDEFVIRKESRQKIEGEAPGFLDHLNRRGAKALRGILPGYSQGGRAGGDGSVLMDGQRVSDIAARQIRLMERLAKVNFRVMQGGYGGHHITASGSSHNYPGVVDLGPASIRYEKLARQVGFAAWARNIAGRGRIGSGAHIHAVSLLDPGDAKSPQVYGSWAGHRTGLNGGGADPAPHYAWLPNLRKLLGNIPLAHLGGGGGSGGGYSGPSAKDARSALNPGRWLDALKHMGPWGGALGGMMGGVVGKLKSVVVSKIKAAARAVFLGGGAASPSGNVQRYSNVTAMVLQALGAPVSLIPAVLRRMNQESGGNLRAVNHTDINARRGYPSTGLMQVIRPTYQRYRPHPDRGPFLNGVSVDAYSNIFAGLNYAKHNYPSIAYAMNKPGGYDSGGYIPPGLSSVYNGTRKPEAVFTGKQWADIHTLATRGADAGRGAPMVHIENQYTSDPGAAARETRREQMKAVALMRLSG